MHRPHIFGFCAPPRRSLPLSSHNVALEKTRRDRLYLKNEWLARWMDEKEANGWVRKILQECALFSRRYNKCWSCCVSFRWAWHTSSRSPRKSCAIKVALKCVDGRGRKGLWSNSALAIKSLGTAQYSIYVLNHERIRLRPENSTFNTGQTNIELVRSFRNRFESTITVPYHPPA